MVDLSDILIQKETMVDQENLCLKHMWAPCPSATLLPAICQSHWNLVSGTAFRNCLKGLQQWPWCSAPGKLAPSQDSSLSTWLSSAAAIFHGKTCLAKETGWDVLPNPTSKLPCFENCPLSFWPDEFPTGCQRLYSWTHTQAPPSHVG